MTNLIYEFQQWTVIGQTGQIGPIAQPVAAKVARPDPEPATIHHPIPRAILAKVIIRKSRIVEIPTRSVPRSVS